MPQFIPLNFYSYTWSSPDIKPEQVIAPPYDVLSATDRENLAAQSPYNVVHVDLPETYSRAGEILTEWKNKKVISKTNKPLFYIMATDYNVDGTSHTRWGILGGLQLSPFGEGKVFPHEQTYPKAKADRFNLMQATRGQLSPIFGIYDDPDLTLTKIGNKLQNTAPIVDFIQKENSVSGVSGVSSVSSKNGNSVRHRLWSLTESENEKIITLLEKLKVYIADGHHRYETALKFQQEQGPGTIDDPRPWDYVFTYLSNISSPGLEIFPYHRMLSWEKIYPWQDILKKAEKNYLIQKVEHQSSLTNIDNEAACILYIPEKYYLLQPKNKPESIFDQIGAHVLDKYFLRQAMDLSDLELSSGSFLSYTPFASEAITKVDKGDIQAAFLLKPVSMSVLQTVCQSGQVMPRKSTYFYPKLPTGLLFYLWD
jgi:uncharacterized protein (DUF1015 family)